jgi:succinoglycan biosynthesis transport protein ExoP
MNPVSTSRSLREREPLAAPATMPAGASLYEKPPQRWDWDELHRSASRLSWTRYLAALRRYKWLLALVIAAAIGVGIVAARLTKPVYVVHSTIWITPDTRQDERAAPIRGDQVMHAAAWAELLSSFAILDRVAKRMGLYFAPTTPADSILFRDFRTTDAFRPGVYDLNIDAQGRLYTLSLVKGQRVETGVVGDSIGRTVGFLWAPSPALLGLGRTVRFNVVSPRTAALGIRSGLTSSLPEGSNLLRVTMTGTNPQRLTAITRALVDEFVAAAADLKKRNLVEVSRTLDTQLQVTAKELHDAESALEAFRVRTITLPSETAPTTAAATGAAPRDPSATDGAATDPVATTFFAQQLTYDGARRQRAALERTMDAVRAGTLDASALSSVPAARTDPELQAALHLLVESEAKLAAARQEFTDAHPTVRALAAAVKELREQTIPHDVEALDTQLQMREADMQDQVETTARALRNVPVRSIEQERLRRNLATTENLYALLKMRSAEANLAEATAVADVSVLDAPVVPEAPTSNRAPFVIALSTIVGLVAAGGLAFLLDRYDPRFRYPEQASDEMGLDIIGAVPAIKTRELGEQAGAMQLIEAFRTIRLGVSQAADPSGRVLLTVSSPNAGDGKSMICANLAQSFAEAGYRTLLIDGDIRRGELDKRFGVPRSPGLLDYVTGAATLEETLHQTSNDKLWIMARGTQQQRGPELLMSPVVPNLMTELQRRFETVIIDCSPLGAGIDPFVLGAATGNVLLVLRAGESNRKLAEAKLKLITRLPIRLLGVVLNDVEMAGDFQYYAYSYSDQSEQTKIPALESQLDEFARRSGLLSLER